MGRVFKLQVVTCGPATKTLNNAFVKLPVIAPAWGCGEDNVGVNVVMFFPNPLSESIVKLATFESNKTSSLMSEGVRLQVVMGGTLRWLRIMATVDGEAEIQGQRIEAECTRGDEDDGTSDRRGKSTTVSSTDFYTRITLSWKVPSPETQSYG